MSKIRHEDKQAPPQPEPETGLTTAEQTFIQGLIDPTTSIEAVVPAEVNPESFWHGLTICCRAMKLMRRMVERLRPVIGRMLVVAQQNPEVYQQKGYRTYEDFLTKGVCETLGLSRSDAYEAKRVALKWPSLTPADYAEIGSVKMTMISRIADESSSAGRKLLKRAKQLTIRELRTELETKLLVEKGEFQGAVIIINTTEAIRAAWEEFVATPEVQAVCGTADRGVILLHAIEECSTWRSEADSGALPEFTGLGFVEDALGPPPWFVPPEDDVVRPPTLREGERQ